MPAWVDEAALGPLPPADGNASRNESDDTGVDAVLGALGVSLARRRRRKKRVS